MKILMVGNDLSVKGGITSVISQIMAHDWEKDGVEIKYIPTYIEATAIRKIIFFADAYRKIRTEFTNGRPDVVHIHMSYKGSFIRKFQIHKLCKRYKIPDIVHLHGSEFKKWYDGSGDKKQKQIKTLLKECSTFIVLGEQWEKIIKEIEPKARTLIVSNTVRIPKETVSWDIPFKVLFMGVLIQRKGLADLLRAVKVLKNEKKVGDMKFIIAGSGPEEEALKALSAELNIEDCLEFVGWVDGEQKKKLYKECQMLVLPSYNEGLPIAVLEAISYGMPVVATDVGDISSAVQSGQNGELVIPGNIEMLSSGIRYICASEGRYRKFSAKSREIAKTRFSEDFYFDTLGRLYSHLFEMKNRYFWNKK